MKPIDYGYEDYETEALLEVYDRASEGLYMSDGMFVGCIPECREELAGRKVSNEKLDRIDRDVLTHIDGLEEDYTDFATIDDSQPLRKWWWHLAKLKAGDYPLEILPKDLRQALRSDPQDAAA